jgi:hypothetical protein
MHLQKLADGREALCDPWPGVQQFGSLAEHRVVDRDSGTSHALEFLDRFPKQQRRLAVTEELQLRFFRNSESESSGQPWRGSRAGWERARIWVAGIEALGGFPYGFRIRGRSREYRNAVERTAGTTPLALSNPRLGFSPIRLLNAAGTRPDPAVSVPREKAHKPLATATAEPELDPPEMYLES